PLERLITIARDAGVCTVVDVAQAVAHERLAFSELGCDFMAFSGHKMLGPMGIGALLGRTNRLEEIEPQRLGGGMVAELGALTEGPPRWRELPARLEGGTPNVAGAIGLAAAVDYLDGLGRERIADHEAALIEQLAVGLDAIGAVPLGPSTGGASLVSFTLPPHHPHDVAQILDEHGVAVRAGMHCAQPLHRHLGLSATIRASVAPYNGTDDIEALLAGLRRVRAVLG
ncbi:MAG: aminotransferase class V-fold PLP-dependent enzyme, partial [Myxococcales bacterium]|nr:aminotransferase class V-fold PLP-dependent enzyme [Myxococcales bacterium]